MTPSAMDFLPWSVSKDVIPVWQLEGARSGVALATTDVSVPASGGTGRIAITTARECAWTANSNVAWLTLSGPASGQGDGSVEYAVASNSDATIRRGVIELNDQKANVT